MKQSIKKYTIEFAVIFLSITLSFLIEEWRTSRQERKVANEFLQRLSAEIRERTLQTQYILDNNKSMLKNLERIAINFKTQEIADDTLFQYLIESEGAPTLNPELETWESLLSSGVLVNIEPSIIDSVNSLLASYKNVALQNKYFLELSIPTWPLMVENIPPTEVADQWIKVLKKSGISLNEKNYEPRKRADLSKLRNSPVAIDYYFTKVLIGTGVVSSLRSIPGKEKRLIELLEKELQD